MASGATAGSCLKLLLKNFNVLAWPVVSLVYPLFASVKAIESKTHVGDEQWLTYWVLYSLIMLFELTCYRLIEWIPFWHYVKLILTCWLVMPYFSGAAYVYNRCLRPLFVNPQTVNVWYVPGKKDDDKPLTVEKRVDWADTSKSYIGCSAFDDTYGYGY